MDALGAHFLLSFEVDGRQHPLPDLLALRVVEHLDVVERVLAGFGAGPVGPGPHPLSR